MCNEIYKIENNILFYINKTYLFFSKKKSIICFVVGNNKFLFINNKIIFISSLSYDTHIYRSMFLCKQRKRKCKKKKNLTFQSL